MSSIIALFHQLNHPDQSIRTQANQQILSIVNQPDILPLALQMMSQSEDQLTIIVAFTLLCKIVKRQPDKTDLILGQISKKSIHNYPRACQIIFSDILSVRGLLSQQGWILNNIGTMEIPFKIDFVQNLYDNAMLFSLKGEQKSKKLREGLSLVQTWIISSLGGGQSDLFLQSICQKKFPIEQTGILQAILKTFEDNPRTHVKLLSKVVPYLKQHQFQSILRHLKVLMQTANQEVAQAAVKFLFHSRIYQKQLMRLLFQYVYRSSQSLGLYFDLFQLIYEDVSEQNQWTWTYILELCLIHSSTKFAQHALQREYTQDLLLYCYLRNNTLFNQKVSDLLKSQCLQDQELLCFMVKAVVQQCQEIQQYKLVLLFLSQKCPHQKLNIPFLSCLFYAQALLDSQQICIQLLAAVLKLHEIQECCSLACQCISLALPHLSEVNIDNLCQIIATSIQKGLPQRVSNELILLLIKITKFAKKDRYVRYLQILGIIKAKGYSHFIENDLIYTLVDLINKENVCQYTKIFYQQLRGLAQQVLASICLQDKKIKLVKLLLEVLPACDNLPLFQECMRLSLAKHQYLQITANCIDKFAITPTALAQYLHYLRSHYFFQGLQSSLNLIKIMLKSLRFGIFNQSVLDFSKKFISQIKYRKQGTAMADYLKGLRRMGFIKQSELLRTSLVKILMEKNWVVQQINNIEF